MRPAAAAGQGEGPARWQDTCRSSHARAVDARRPLPWSPPCWWHVAERALGVRCRPPPFAHRSSAMLPEQSRHSVACAECRDCSGATADGLSAQGEHRSPCVARRRAGFCRRRLIAGAPQRATRLGVRRGFHAHRGRPRGLQSWPGGGSRRAWPACGRRSRFLNIHVPMTHATRL